jgi:hypothetical protein
METVMLEEHEIDFETIDYAALTPAQWDLVKRRAKARACQAQSGAA